MGSLCWATASSSWGFKLFVDTRSSESKVYGRGFVFCIFTPPPTLWAQRNEVLEILHWIFLVLNGIISKCCWLWLGNGLKLFNSNISYIAVSIWLKTCVQCVSSYPWELPVHVPKYCRVYGADRVQASTLHPMLVWALVQPVKLEKDSSITALICVTM